MLTVAEEPGGYAQLCQVCALDREEPRNHLFVITWAPGAGHPTRGGMVRLCWEHLDELAILIAEVL